MKALLIIAHGSRNEAANNEVLQMAARLEAMTASAFDRVAHAYLEIADPPVDQAVDALAAFGIDEISVFPYFLASGSHVASDVPRLVGEAEEKHPRIRFDILPYLGALEGLDSLILKHLARNV